MAEQIRIFIGCDPNDCDLEQLLVLHYSLLKYSSLPLDITLLQISPDPRNFWFSDPVNRQGWNTTRWATPFSGLRWGIPAFCAGSGRAIYLDADIIALSDIAELWNMPIAPGKIMLAAGAGRRLRLGTLVWDCAAAMRVLPPLDEIRHEAKAHDRLKDFFQSAPQLVQPLAPAYSNLDGDGLPLSALKMLHYSDMGSQFSHRYALPRLQAEGRAHWFDGKIYEHPRRDLTELFDATYREALEAGFTFSGYRALPPFGAFPKKSERRYRGNEITRSFLGMFKRQLLIPYSRRNAQKAGKRQ